MSRRGFEPPFIMLFGSYRRAPEGSWDTRAKGIVVSPKCLYLNLNLSALRNQIQVLCSRQLTAAEEELLINAFIMLWLPFNR